MASNLNVNDPEIKHTRPAYNYDIPKVCESPDDILPKNEETKQETISTPSPSPPTQDSFRSIQTLHDQPKVVRPTAIYPELPRLDLQTANPIWPSGNDIIRPVLIRSQPFAYPVITTHIPSVLSDDQQLQHQDLKDDAQNTRFYTLRRKRPPLPANNKHNDY